MGADRQGDEAVTVAANNAIPMMIDTDDEPTEPHQRTIIGTPAIKRPWSKLSRELVEFAAGFGDDAQTTIDRAARLASAAIDARHQAVAGWMELACAHVMMLGYRPEECVIEQRDYSSTVHYVLRVGRLECFAVVVSRRWGSAAATPSLLGWPPSL